MNIVLMSIFRNSATYVDRYARQAAMLRDELTKLKGDYHLRLVLTEGDSTDNTFDLLDLALAGHGFDYDLETFNHGGPVFGSVDRAQRWINISKVCNFTLERVRQDDDLVIYVESDLLWAPSTMVALMRHHTYCAAVAPMCFHGPTGKFYDTWGHRKNGIQFQPDSPYHPNLGDVLTPIDSAGSCIVMRGEVARKARFTPPEFGMVGFGYNINDLGYGLWLDPHQIVIHP